MIEPKVAMISSSLKLSDLARKIAPEMEIYTASLERAISIGRDLEAKGVGVIISLGGTAAILRRTLSVPVLAIPISAFDLIENILDAHKYGQRIAISSYANPISQIENLEQLLDLQIKQIVYNGLETLRIGIFEAKREGIEAIIGGNFCFEISQEIGLPCVLVSSTEGTIRSVMEQANILAVARSEEKEKTKRIEAILDSVSEGIVAIDQNGMTIVFNKVGEQILGMEAKVGLHVDTIVPQLGLYEVLSKTQSKLNVFRKVGKSEVIANMVPIYMRGKVIGAIASFTDVSEVMSIQSKVRRSFAKQFVAKHTVDDIICESREMKEVIKQMMQFANSDSTLLITGESGTGKELVAQSVHNLSQRKREPFVSINCLAIPENLLESELFGHEEGAFTGSKKGGKLGLFELANKGTIFLDEIGSISHSLQASLLRVLQQKEVMRIGGERMIPVDVRIIAATNKDLLTELKSGRIRQDFYFRLNILRIQISPLRDRRDDIPHLVTSQIDYFTHKYGKKPVKLAKSLVDKFLDYSWPGNIRELQNLIERFVLIADEKDHESVLNTLFEDSAGMEAVLSGSANNFTSTSASEVDEIIKANKKELAERLGVSRTTLWRRLKSLQSNSR